MTRRYYDGLIAQMLLKHRQWQADTLHELSAGKLKARANWTRESQLVVRIYWMLTLAGYDRQELAETSGVVEASIVMCRFELDVMFKLDSRAHKWQHLGDSLPSIPALSLAISSVSRLSGRPEKRGAQGDRFSNLVAMYSQMGIRLTEENLAKILKRYARLPENLQGLFDTRSARVVRRRRRKLMTLANSLADAIAKSRR